jgi:hypothetical protein
MNQRQRQRKLVPVYMVVIIVLIIAIASGGGDVSIPEIGTPEVALFPHGIKGNPSPAQQAGFDRLAQNSKEPPFVRIEEGAVRFMNMAVPILANKSATPEEQAREFIQEYADLLAIDNPSKNLLLMHQPCK